MIYLKLLFTFVKIGLFSFGGGYAMIPLIQKEIETNGWLSSSEFIDIIAVAEMTPGPIAVNSATFVGYKTAGFLGGLSATLGVTLPSLILILAVSYIFFKYQSHPLKVMVFYGIRPVITGLILAASIFVAQTSLFWSKLSLVTIKQVFINPLEIINIGSIIIFLATILALKKYKMNPILTILGAGALGILFFHVI